jgi:hypothetical protein
VLVLPRRDLISDQVSRLDSTECKLWVKDFKLPSDKFNAPTSRLLALHHHHLRETMLDRVPQHGDPVLTIMGRMGISLIGVHRSSLT